MGYASWAEATFKRLSVILCEREEGIHQSQRRRCYRVDHPKGHGALRLPPTDIGPGIDHGHDGEAQRNPKKAFEQLPFS